MDRFHVSAGLTLQGSFVFLVFRLFAVLMSLGTGTVLDDGPLSKVWLVGIWVWGVLVSASGLFGSWRSVGSGLSSRSVWLRCVFSF